MLPIQLATELERKSAGCPRLIAAKRFLRSFDGRLVVVLKSSEGGGGEVICRLMAREKKETTGGVADKKCPRATTRENSVSNSPCWEKKHWEKARASSKTWTSVRLTMARQQCDAVMGLAFGGSLLKSNGGNVNDERSTQRQPHTKPSHPIRVVFRKGIASIQPQNTFTAPNPRLLLASLQSFQLQHFHNTTTPCLVFEKHCFHASD